MLCVDAVYTCTCIYVSVYVVDVVVYVVDAVVYVVDVVVYVVDVVVYVVDVVVYVVDVVVYVVDVVVLITLSKVFSYVTSASPLWCTENQGPFEYEAYYKDVEL